VSLCRVGSASDWREGGEKKAGNWKEEEDSSTPGRKCRERRRTGLSERGGGSVIASGALLEVKEEGDERLVWS